MNNEEIIELLKAEMERSIIFAMAIEREACVKIIQDLLLPEESNYLIKVIRQRGKSEYNMLREKAIEKGWKIAPHKSPLNADTWDHAWIAYWRAMENYEANPDIGRPIPPHSPNQKML